MHCATWVGEVGSHVGTPPFALGGHLKQMVKKKNSLACAEAAEQWHHKLDFAMCSPIILFQCSSVTASPTDFLFLLPVSSSPCPYFFLPPPFSLFLLMKPQPVLTTYNAWNTTRTTSELWLRTQSANIVVRVCQGWMALLLLSWFHICTVMEGFFFSPLNVSSRWTNTGGGRHHHHENRPL